MPCSCRTGGQPNISCCRDCCQPHTSHPWWVWLTTFPAISGPHGQQYPLQLQNGWSTQYQPLQGMLSTIYQPSLVDLVDHFSSYFWTSWSTISPCSCRTGGQPHISCCRECCQLHTSQF